MCKIFNLSCVRFRIAEHWGSISLKYVLKVELKFKVKSYLYLSLWVIFMNLCVRIDYIFTSLKISSLFGNHISSHASVGVTLVFKAAIDYAPMSYFNRSETSFYLHCGLSLIVSAVGIVKETFHMLVLKFWNVTTLITTLHFWELKLVLN